MTTVEPQASELLARWRALLAEEPGVRARNAAARLGVSEGELVAARCGDGVTRMRNDHQALLESLVQIGELLTITRNDHAVHEKRGYYSNLQLKEHGGGAFDHNINLRIYFNNWAHVFAVTQLRSAWRSRKPAGFRSRRHRRAQDLPHGEQRSRGLGPGGPAIFRG